MLQLCLSGVYYACLHFCPFAILEGSISNRKLILIDQKY